MPAGIFEEKVPYLVTILFAAAGWVVTYAVDKVDKAPSIEYTIRHEPGKLLVDLHNITRTVSFKGLEFAMGTDIPGKFKDGYFVKPSGTEWEGNQDIVPIGGTLPFTIDNFQPGWKFTFVGEYEGSDQVRFYIANSRDQVVHLVESNVETFFVDHELPILFLLLLLWGSITAILLLRAT